jgi:glycosyltransferase involved in cell wall biosynthesis
MVERIAQTVGPLCLAEKGIGQQPTDFATAILPKQAHNRALRVLLVTPFFFPNMGGVETHVYEVARRLARAGVAVTVLTTDRTGQLPGAEEVDGVQIRRVRAWPAQRDYCLAPAIAAVIQSGGWDIVHVQSYHTLVAPLAMWAAWRAQIPYIVTFHGGGHSSHLRNGLRAVQHLLLRPLLARAERLVAVANFEIEFYSQRLRLPAERFVYIPNGADIAKVEGATAPPPHSSLIASVGRLERYKGHQRVIAALPYILQQRPDIHLWIAGAGPYKSALERLAAKLGVADRVEIRAIPAADRTRMAAELAKAALVTVLSDYETHPIAALEALALGRSLLVTDTSGLRELAERGLARAVPLTSTASQVAAAVLEQLQHPLLPAALTLPSWDACARELLSLYQSCVGGEQASKVWSAKF